MINILLNKNNLKNTTPFIILIGIVLISSTQVFAQGPPPPPPPGLEPGLPIDGGILFLAASALVYGVRKLRN